MLCGFGKINSFFYLLLIAKPTYYTIVELFNALVLGSTHDTRKRNVRTSVPITLFPGRKPTALFTDTQAGDWKSTSTSNFPTSPSILRHCDLVSTLEPGLAQLLSPQSRCQNFVELRIRKERRGKNEAKDYWCPNLHQLHVHLSLSFEFVGSRIF